LLPWRFVQWSGLQEQLQQPALLPSPGSLQELLTHAKSIHIQRLYSNLLAWLPSVIRRLKPRLASLAEKHTG